MRDKRFDDSPDSRRVAIEAYIAELELAGVARNDPQITHFTREVFHDGEIENIEISPTIAKVDIMLRNVYAVNTVYALMRNAGVNRPAIDKKDFQTRVSFLGVSDLRIRWESRIRNYIYQSSRICAIDSHFRMSIFLPESKRSSFIQLDYDRIEIEDISKKLSRYVNVEAVGNVYFPLNY